MERLKCSAKYVPLTPISFLERSAIVYRDKLSVVYGDVKYTWRETYQRCIKLASALAHHGISRGDVVAALAPNIPALFELHFGVPMAGAVLCTLNIRHDSAMVSVLLRHSEAKAIFVDYQFLPIAQGALELLTKTGSKLPFIVLIQDCNQPAPISSKGNLEYESLLAMGKLDFEIIRPNVEWDPISLNYTSGTTSSPKGVRGAHLNRHGHGSGTGGSGSGTGGSGSRKAGTGTEPKLAGSGSGLEPSGSGSDPITKPTVPIGFPANRII